MVSLLGLGSNALCLVRTNHTGQMDVSELEKLVSKALTEGLLAGCHSAHATCIFQQDTFYDVSYDSGDKSVQCSQKPHIFKLWLTWKARGSKGLERDIDVLFENARYFADRIRATQGFQLVFQEPQCANVCFWYIPPSMQQREQTTMWWQKMGEVAPKIKERMMKAGTLMIGYQPLGGKVNFFRMVVGNPRATRSDMDFVIDEIQRLGSDL